jgi:hypothetical protein
VHPHTHTQHRPGNENKYGFDRCYEVSFEGKAPLDGPQCAMHASTAEGAAEQAGKG